MDAPSNDNGSSFETDIKPLFRERDRQSMERAFDLWSFDDVRTHSAKILERIKDGTMPCDGAWTPEQIQVLQVGSTAAWLHEEPQPLAVAHCLIYRQVMPMQTRWERFKLWLAKRISNRKY